ncbi:MAG TPA: DivIVA domain-containing protein [Pseudonocardiaceae bacterium]|jgi:DivIVA domain-containing protein
MSLSADDVRDVVFSRSRRGRDRYIEVEVDGFLGLIEATMRGTSDLAAKDVHRVTFSKPPRGKHGYHAKEVDAFLRRAEAALTELEALGPEE